ncbi:MAG TPA: ATP-grasp domain-containing protein, partial [Clostridia bacterium]|nr:ATP-grasp domain-containing protein [Clostridia bacterium]
MKLLFEYVGKQTFADYGIRIPWGKVATTPEEAEKIAREIGKPVVVKSQVTIGK